MEHDDRFFDALTPGPAPPFDEELRRRILDRTTRQVERRRWMIRLRSLAALAACFAAGALTMKLGEAGRPVERPSDLSAEGSLPVLSLDEWRDLLARERPAELHRRSGDHHLDETGNLAQAVRSYVLALDAGSDEELAISTERDSWLLMALKESRRTEERHGKKNG